MTETEKNTIMSLELLECLLSDLLDRNVLQFVENSSEEQAELDEMLANSRYWLKKLGKRYMVIGNL